jgi:hypothetical protein
MIHKCQQPKVLDLSLYVSVIAFCHALTMINSKGEGTGKVLLVVNPQKIG